MRSAGAHDSSMKASAAAPPAAITRSRNTAPAGSRCLNAASHTPAMTTVARFRIEATVTSAAGWRW
jgi:hypothetical protein